MCLDVEIKDLDRCFGLSRFVDLLKVLRFLLLQLDLPIRYDLGKLMIRSL